MLKGDWTQRNEEITRFLNRYDRVGVPFYVLYSNRNPAGQVLPEVLTKSAFLDFLDKEYP
jgi:thiol:disulfide interchange protein